MTSDPECKGWAESDLEHLDHGAPEQGWVWPSEAEVRGVGEHELWDEAMQRIEEAPKPNRAQRRAQARQHMGRETRRQLHGFGRWRRRG